jgi:hypothetical protein
MNCEDFSIYSGIAVFTFGFTTNLRNVEIKKNVPLSKYTKIKCKLVLHFESIYTVYEIS